MSVCTDPLNPYTDGDGIKDGYEVQNLSMMNISFSLWSGILHSRDYDHDGLLDGYEIRVSYYINQSDSENWSAGKYLNPANASDAYEDFDGDGLTNLEEYRMGHDGRLRP